MSWSVSGIPPSVWLGRPALPEEVETVVVGGGFVGVSTAWWLAAEGADVILLEADHLAGKASGRNAGFLLTGTAEPLISLSRRIGEERAVTLWERSRENRELLRRAILDPGLVDCGFTPEGSWIAALDPELGDRDGADGPRAAGGEGELEELEASAAMLAERGFEIEWRDRAAVERASGSPRLAGALFQPHDGGLDPVALIRGLVRLGRFETRTGVRVHALEARGDRVNLSTSAGEILAERVVLALNAYAPQLLSHLARQVRPVRGQMLATAPADERRLEGIWYVNHGYDYVRQLIDGTFVAGGRRHLAEAEERGYLESPTAGVQGALQSFVGEVFPWAAGLPVRYRWAGTMGFTEDHRPVIDTVPDVPAALYAAGFSGHGMSLGFVTGRYLARRVLGGERTPLF